MRNIGITVLAIIFTFYYGLYAYFGFHVRTRSEGWTVLSKLDSLFYMTVGFILIIGSYLYYRNKPKEIEASKCPQCKNSYNYYELDNGICPICKIKTIDLEIYFDKYPEDLKDVP